MPQAVSSRPRSWPSLRRPRGPLARLGLRRRTVTSIGCRASRSASRQPVTVLRDQPVGLRRHPRDSRQQNRTANDLPDPPGGAQHRGDCLVSRSDRAVDLNPLQGIGSLLLGYPQLSEVGELPGDDLRIRSDPLHCVCALRAERAVPVVDQHRAFSLPQSHDSPSSRSVASCTTWDRVLPRCLTAMK